MQSHHLKGERTKIHFRSKQIEHGEGLHSHRSMHPKTTLGWLRILWPPSPAFAWMTYLNTCNPIEPTATQTQSTTQIFHDVCICTHAPNPFYSLAEHIDLSFCVPSQIMKRNVTPATPCPTVMGLCACVFVKTSWEKEDGMLFYVCTDQCNEQMDIQSSLIHCQKQTSDGVGGINVSVSVFSFLFLFPIVVFCWALSFDIVFFWFCYSEYLYLCWVRLQHQGLAGSVFQVLCVRTRVCLCKRESKK